MIYLKHKKRISKLISICLTFTFIFLCSCSNQGASEPLGDEIKVTVLDVGQGDSIFIQLTDERCMLIDAGESQYGDDVVDYINSIGYEKIDYLIATHPHADHIGGMSKVLESFDIGEVYMPKVSTTTKTFENMLELIDDKGLEINTAKSGINILSEDNLNIDIIAPCSEEYSDLNNYSAVIKITYGSVKFLFMGDAEEKSENEITADVSADFIKVGHHGSKTSSSEDFVNRVGAQFAAVSVAAENDYGLPDEEIISLWEDSGAKVLMTKDVGNIVAQSDGQSLTVNGENQAADVESATENEESQTTAAETIDTSTETQASEIQSEKWILNTNTKKIHTLQCSLAKNISDKNKDYSDLSIAQLEEQGYTTCKTCKPHD